MTSIGICTDHPLGSEVVRFQAEPQPIVGAMVNILRRTLLTRISRRDHRGNGTVKFRITSSHDGSVGAAPAELRTQLEGSVLGQTLR
jgi:hypothetical protein